MEVSSWDNHRTQWWIFQLAIFSKTRSLKSPGLLLTGLLLKVAILAKKNLKTSKKISKKNIEENPKKTTKERIHTFQKEFTKTAINHKQNGTNSPPKKNKQL